MDSAFEQVMFEGNTSREKIKKLLLPRPYGLINMELDCLTTMIFSEYHSCQTIKASEVKVRTRAGMVLNSVIEPVACSLKYRCLVRQNSLYLGR
jgi:hypothetical protein